MKLSADGNAAAERPMPLTSLFVPVNPRLDSRQGERGPHSVAMLDVRDLARSVFFYLDKLGLPVKSE